MATLAAVGQGQRPGDPSEGYNSHQVRDDEAWTRR